MFYIVSFSLILILLITVILLSILKNNNLPNKSDSFECGFYSLNNPSTPFNLPFFYVTLMFLIFDLELALLVFYPLNSNSSYTLFINTWFTILLILLLTIYEWEKDLINWF